MVTLLIALLSGLLAVGLQAVIAPQPPLDRLQNRHYESSKRFISLVHHVPEEYEPLDRLAHLLPAHPRLEEDAWQFAHAQGNGAVFWTLDAKEKNIFATTRIPSRSRFGMRWNLDWTAAPRDAYAFWHIKKGGQKQLLRLDVWPAHPDPAPLEEVALIEWLVERLR